MSITDTETAPLKLPTIDGGVRIGHVHLKVADLERALGFYVGVLGFTLTTRYPGAAFISGRGLPSSHRPQYLGKQRWLAAASRHHRTLPHRHSLPEPAAAGRCPPPADRRQNPA